MKKSKFERMISKQLTEFGIRFFTMNAIVRNALRINPGFSFIAACLPDEVKGMEDILKQCSVSNIQEIKSTYSVAYYFESRDQENYALLFAPNDSFLKLDEEAQNFSSDVRMVRDMKESAKRLGIQKLTDLDSASFFVVNIVFNQLTQKIFDISFLKLFYIKYLNSQRLYEKWFKNYQKNIYPENDEHDHIINFSRIYYWDVKAISDNLNGTVDGITIHDVATAFANFPLLLSHLSKEDLMSINIKQIYASDRGPITARWVISKIKKGIQLRNPLTIMKIDLLKQIHKMPETDVIIANDVLEHFKEEDSKQLLKNLWEKTRKLLLVHVPFENEKELNSTFDHLTSFNPDKLMKWASELKNAGLISDNYKERGDAPLIQHGYMFLLKR